MPRPRIAWSPDSTALVASLTRDASQFVNLHRLPIQAGAVPERLTDQPDYGQFPLAWSTTAGGILYIEGVHPQSAGDIYFVSLTGGRDPAWSPDGRHLSYLDDGRNLVEVALPEPGGKRPTPRQLVHGPVSQAVDVWTPSYSVARDGRFLVTRQVSYTANVRINIVLNWFQERQRLSPQ